MKYLKLTLSLVLLLLIAFIAMWIGMFVIVFIVILLPFIAWKIKKDQKRKKSNFTTSQTKTIEVEYEIL